MEQGWSAVSLLVEGNVVMEVSEQLHVPGHSIQRSISWPMEDAVDLLFIHPMAGSCTLLDKVVRESSQLPKLVYVGINPLLPPPIRAAPDFIHHWKNHQQLSQQVLASQSEEPEAWAVRSMSSHFLAQCSLSQAAAMLRKDYVLVQVEHLFAVFAQKSILKELQLQDSMGGVAEFEAWRRGWFCSPLSPVLLSLEQLAGTDDQWLSIGAMTQEDAQQAAVSLGCDFLERQELLPDQVHMKCEVSRHLPQRDVPPWQQRLRVQWSLKQPMCPGVALQLAQEGHGHCPVHGGNTECECFAPWRGLHCNILDATEAAQARNYSAAVQYIVNEDPIHLAELRHSLRNFWRRFNKNFDYPVQVFHDGLSDETRASLVRASPNRIWFHHLPEDFLPPVEKLPLELVVEDETRTVSHHTFSAGYRAQCRFRAGPLFEHPAVASLDYLMSLDTDSMLPAELARDPFLEMHQNSSKILGYSKLAISSSAYVRGLWAAVLQYLAYEGINLTESRQKAFGEAQHFLQRFLLDQSKDTLLVAYNFLVAMTDFEVLRVSFFKPGSDYFRFYRFIDELGGFWLYRWGDHAIRGLGTAIALFPHEVKQASDGRLVAYDLQVPYAHQDTCLCQDPKLRCADRGKAASGEALWPETKKVWECIPKT